MTNLYKTLHNFYNDYKKHNFIVGTKNKKQFNNSAKVSTFQQLYKTCFHNFTTSLHKQKTYTLLDNTVRHFAKKKSTLHNLTQYNTLQNFSQLHKTLYKSMHNYTKLYNTLQYVYTTFYKSV